MAREWEQIALFRLRIITETETMIGGITKCVDIFPGGDAAVRALRQEDGNG